MRSTSSSERCVVRPAGWAGRTCARGEQGMATAELAVVLPVLVLVTSLLLTVVGVASDTSRSYEAARSAARASSVGTTESEVRAQATQLAPEGAAVRIWTDGPWVRVEVVAPGRHWGPLPLPAPEQPAQRSSSPAPRREARRRFGIGLCVGCGASPHVPVGSRRRRRHRIRRAPQGGTRRRLGGARRRTRVVGRRDVGLRHRGSPCGCQRRKAAELLALGHCAPHRGGSDDLSRAAAGGQSDVQGGCPAGPVRVRAPSSSSS